MIDADVVAFVVHQNQICPFPFAEGAAIVKLERLRRIFRYQMDGTRQGEIILLICRNAEGSVQQAGGIIIR
jgi:hypothetical protein